MPNANNLEGLRFNNWFVLNRKPVLKGKNLRWFCRCDCGREKWVFGFSLISGRSKRCGCLGFEGLERFTNDPKVKAQQGIPHDRTYSKHPKYRKRMSKLMKRIMNDDTPRQRFALPQHKHDRLRWPSYAEKRDLGFAMKHPTGVKHNEAIRKAVSKRMKELARLVKEQGVSWKNRSSVLSSYGQDAAASPSRN